MASTIDTTQPPEGRATTAKVRDNFAAAKSEIEALQARVAYPYTLDDHLHLYVSSYGFDDQPITEPPAPFETLAGAIAYAQGIDNNGYTVSIHLPPDLYQDHYIITGLRRYATLNIVGDQAPPFTDDNHARFVPTNASAPIISVLGQLAAVRLINLAFDAPDMPINHVLVNGGGYLLYENCYFGKTNEGAICVTNRSWAEALGPLWIVASMPYFLNANNTSMAHLHGITITLLNKPHFGAVFAYLYRNSWGYWGGITLIGQATGVRGAIGVGSIVELGGSPQTTIPGNQDMYISSGSAIY